MARYFFLSLALLTTPALKAAEPALHNPIEVTLIDLKAKLDDGRVIVTWKRYKRDDFISYRLMKSDVDPAPVFPATMPIYTTKYAADTRYEDGYLSAGAWHYRLCIMTRYGDRWCSPSVSVVVGPDDVKRSAPTAADFEP